MKRANNKIQTFVYNGLGFPIKLINVPMKKMLGEWVIDVDMNKLQLAVLRALIFKSTRLTGDELNFIRSFLNMTMAEFGKAFGVSHVAVLKWENEERNVSPPLEFCIRLYILDHLHVRDKEFRNLYNQVSLDMLSKSKEGKIHPLAIDIAEDLKIAL
jgi:DNA-binding transcriptional regulator YiaG